jgi:hypothetical protein
MGRSVSGASSGNQFLTTASSIGFTAGDPIYNTSQGLGRVSDTAVSTASFGFTASAPSAPILSQPNAGTLKYIEYYGGMNVAPAVAQLTNGNVAVAYGKRASGASIDGYVYFKILDANDNVVVSEVTVATTTHKLSGGSIGCLALPNGKFAVIWNGYTTNYYLCFAIYNADGTVSTAATALTTYIAAGPSNHVAFAARSDSSFVVAFYNNTPNVVYHVISSTGTSTYNGNTASGSAGSGVNNQISVTVRSDNSFAIMFTGNGLGVLYYYVYSATNTSIVGTNFSLTGGAGGYSCKTFLLPSDAIGIVYSTSNNAVYFRSYSSAGTLGSEVKLFDADLGSYTGFSANAVNASGNFMVTWAFLPTSTGATGTTQRGKAFYRLFDSSGTALSSATEIRAMNNYSQGSTIQIFPIGTSIRLYRTSVESPSLANSYYWPRGIYYAKVNSTSYALEPFASVSQSAGSASASVNGYNRGGSTLTTASFFPATTQTISASLGPSTSTTSTQFLAQTLIEDATSLGTSCCTLQNGDIAIVYKSASGSYPVKMAIYNSAGVQQTLITVAASASSYVGQVYVIQLTNGKIVVAYNSSVTTVAFSVYSSSYSFLNTLVGQGVYGSGDLDWAISPLGQNSLFIIGFREGSQYMRYSIYNDTTRTLNSQSTTESTHTFNNVQVSGFRSGDFIIWGPCNTTGTVRYYHMGRTSDTSYAEYNISNTSSSTSGTYYRMTNPSVTPDDYLVFYNSSSASALYSKLLSSGGSTSLNSGEASNTTYYNASPGSGSSVGVTGSGDPIIATYPASSGQPLRYGLLPTPSALQNSGVATQATNGYTNLSSTAYSSSNNTVSLQPYNGDAFVAAYLDNSQKPVFGIYYANSTSYSETITAGVTASAPVTIGYSNGYSLVGIAISNCSAGGAGIVQTSGTAVVSNTYPSVTSQSFDFRNRTTLGVKGTISGRIVTIEG